MGQSAIDVENVSQNERNNSQESLILDSKQDFQLDVLPFNSECRVVMANDGEKNCAAILVTADLVMEMKQYIDNKRDIEELLQRLDEARRKLSSTNDDIDSPSIETKYQEDSGRFLFGSEDTEDPMHEARQIEKDVELEVRWARSRIEMNSSSILDTFEKALSDAKLLREDVFDDAGHRYETISGQFSNCETEPDDGSGSGLEPLSYEKKLQIYHQEIDYYYTPETVYPLAFGEGSAATSSSQDRNLKEAHQQYKAAFDERQEMQDSLDQWPEDYAHAKADYIEDLDADETDMTLEEFESFCLDRWRNRTQNLETAEYRFEQALAKVRALSKKNGLDQESNFIDDLEDGVYSGASNMQQGEKDVSGVQR
ncbi:MAG: hypothetical protein Q9190_005092 [Brigantiaea leucoxantha]